MEKKNLVPNSVHTRPAQENSEKNCKKIQKLKKKKSFWPYFWPDWDQIGREREKKILVPNSVHTESGKENSEKNSKKIQKMKNPLSGIIFSQFNRPRNGEKKFSPKFRSYSTRARKFRKKQQKISKLKKTSFRHCSQPKRDQVGREREKKFLVPNSVHTQSRKEYSEKKQQKNEKTSFRHYSQPKRDDIGLEIGKKILVPNSIHTRPG